MKIGTIITVRATVDPFYDNYGYRHLGRHWIKPPQHAWYVGYTFKQEGKYDPGHQRTFTALDEPPDFEPPSLYITNTHKVYRIRFHERGKEHYCFPEDCLTIMTSLRDNYEIPG